MLVAPSGTRDTNSTISPSARGAQAIEYGRGGAAAFSLESLAEFTIKAVGLGILFGIVFGAANAYLGLRAGLTISTSIPLAVIMVAAFAALRPIIGKGTILDVNIGQTAGSASSSLASGTIFTIPALILLGFWQTFNFLETVAIAAFGGMFRRFD